MKCCICGGEVNKHYTPEGEMYWDKGHNPYPVAVDVNGDAIDTEHEDYRCCDVCNAGAVIPARMGRAPKEWQVIKTQLERLLSKGVLLVPHEDPDEDPESYLVPPKRRGGQSK